MRMQETWQQIHSSDMLGFWQKVAQHQRPPLVQLTLCCEEDKQSVMAMPGLHVRLPSTGWRAAGVALSGAHYIAVTFPRPYSSLKNLCKACRSLGPHILLLATHSRLLYLLSNSQHTSHCCSARCLSDGFSAYRRAASAACTCSHHQNLSFLPGPSKHHVAKQLLCSVHQQHVSSICFSCAFTSGVGCTALRGARLMRRTSAFPLSVTSSASSSRRACSTAPVSYSMRARLTRARSANAKSGYSFTMVVYFCNACRSWLKSNSSGEPHSNRDHLRQIRWATWLILPSWIATSASEVSFVTASTCSVMLPVTVGFESGLPTGGKMASLQLISALDSAHTTTQLQLTI